MRILRLARILSNRVWFGKFTSADSLILIQILFTLAAIVFIYIYAGIYAGLIFQVEHPRNPKGFRTFLDALYFAIVTMTTVGYGDIIPLSETGRALTLMMILTGIALIPTQISSLIRYLVKVTNSQQVACGSCGLVVHDQDARFCKQCGTALELKPLP